MPTTRCGHCGTETYISEANKDAGAEAYCSEACASGRVLRVHPDSHVDHIPPEVLAHVLARFKDRAAFFAESFDLPADLPEVECGLWGPVMGDDPIPDAEVCHERRNGRPCLSRIVSRPARPTRTLTVIAGPYQGEPCVLYTAFGGPLAPKEPGDPTIKSEGERKASEEFWAVHALAR